VGVPRPLSLLLTSLRGGGHYTRSSNAPLQGSMGGTSAPYNDFCYGRGHIPPSSPSLCDAPHQLVWSTMNYNLSSAASQGPSSSTTLVGSFPFSFFDTFGNNAFSSVVISARRNLGFGSQHPTQGTIPAQGAHTSQGPWNPW
jgi:hypothetical protein